MAKFEKVSRFADIDITMPERKTAQAAGYDMVVAEDIIIPSYHKLADQMKMGIMAEYFETLRTEEEEIAEACLTVSKTLDEMAVFTKKTKIKPTLVSTGMKCKLEPDTYLELSVRSSCPLKYWLFMANGVGIIDADYYNNPDNEGEIFFQIVNFSPYDIQLKRGDIIGQGIIKPYLTTEDDNASGVRMGGFGSTSK